MSTARLAIVTGKGGVGKTTVAAALARAAIREGQRVLVVEIATPGRLASVLDVDRLPHEPRRLRDDLSAVALDEARALESLVYNLMPLRMLSRRLLSSETFRVLAAAVPGILETALLAQIVGWLEERTGLGRPRWDVIILDAPASGHSVPLLATPRTLSGLATIGPLGDVVRRVSSCLGNPERTSAYVVAIPEEWAVAEAIELYASLRDDLGIAAKRPLLNAVVPRRFSRADEQLLTEADAQDAVDPEMLVAARYFIERRLAAGRHAKSLRSGTGTRPLELPFLFSSTMVWDDLDPLAEALAPAHVG
jgi:anion-transporting  ArsA/GET3 family ATPase